MKTRQELTDQVNGLIAYNDGLVDQIDSLEAALAVFNKDSLVMQLEQDKLDIEANRIALRDAMNIEKSTLAATCAGHKATITALQAQVADLQAQLDALKK